MTYSLKRKKAKHLVEGESIDYQPYYENYVDQNTLLKIRAAWEHKQDGCAGEGICQESVSHYVGDIRRGRYYEKIRNEFVKIKGIAKDPLFREVSFYFEGCGSQNYSADREYVFNLEQNYRDDLEGLLQPPARSFEELFPLLG
jgi:hypothetical protein